MAPVVPAATVPEAAPEPEPMTTEAAPAEWLGQRFWLQPCSFGISVGISISCSTSKPLNPEP